MVASLFIFVCVCVCVSVLPLLFFRARPEQAPSLGLVPENLALRLRRSAPDDGESATDQAARLSCCRAESPSPRDFPLSLNRILFSRLFNSLREPPTTSPAHHVVSRLTGTKPQVASGRNFIHTARGGSLNLRACVRARMHPHIANIEEQYKSPAGRAGLKQVAAVGRSSPCSLSPLKFFLSILSRGVLTRQFPLLSCACARWKEVRRMARPMHFSVLFAVEGLLRKGRRTCVVLPLL